jgi:hypothetical protein
MLVTRSWCGSLMKNSPGDREVPGEKRHRHRAEESSLPSGVEEVHGGGTRHRDASVCHEHVCLWYQVFQLNALSSSDESLCQFDG